MTHRERFFRLFEGKSESFVPFFPDITDWYMGQRIEPGEPYPYEPGQFIPDSSPLHKRNRSMPEELAPLTLLEVYKKYDWGFPVHIYDWFDIRYSKPVSYEEKVEGRRKTRRFRTPRGKLERVEILCEDGSWAPREHYVKELEDLDIMRTVVEHTEYIPRYGRAQAVLDQLGDQGVGDLPVMRSPFGKLVHEYMGLERMVYALFDHPAEIMDFLACQEEKDLEQVRLAAEAPGRIVILSDHADENLIAPPYYREYCIPYYQKACGILHQAQKLVSTHLDGNFKGLFPLLSQTGFDLLDGCTPLPMNNFEVEELAEALPEGMLTYLGVPATLFCQGLETGEILAFGERIFKALAGRVILNVGDILPPNGDIQQVVALGEHVKRLNKS
ncbi:MAG TPA: uroporphyrinogen decarboxylase family protein [archaeon]|nr:uroporphyrinogen decarboxylase family protein [archaeon]